MPGAGGHRFYFVGQETALGLSGRCFSAFCEYVSISVAGFRCRILSSARVPWFATVSSTLDTRKSISRSTHRLLVCGPFNRHSVHTLGDGVRDILIFRKQVRYIRRG